ncbi:hypothetical protein SPHV1_2310067 [Novosphingobium sp. KN65.2]|nr:hypothetical protein SPHV1_2310067 [Novosphingobium sp. KN65.2]
MSTPVFLPDLLDEQGRHPHRSERFPRSPTPFSYISSYLDEVSLGNYVITRMGRSKRIKILKYRRNQLD